MLFNNSVLFALLVGLIATEAAPSTPRALVGRDLGRRAGLLIPSGSAAAAKSKVSSNSSSKKNNKNGSSVNNNQSQNQNQNQNQSNNNNNNNASQTASASASQRTRPCDQGDQSLAAGFQANVVVGLGQQASVLTLQQVLGLNNNNNNNNNNGNNNNSSSNNNNSNNQNNNNSNTGSNNNKNQNLGSNGSQNASKSQGASKAKASGNSSSKVSSGKRAAASANSNKNNANNNNSNQNSSGNNNGNNGKFANADFQAGVDRLNQFVKTSDLQLQMAAEIADDNSLAQPQLSQLQSSLSDQQKLIDSLTGDAAQDGNTLQSLLDSFVTSTGLSQDGANNAVIDCFLPTTLVSA